MVFNWFVVALVVALLDAGSVTKRKKPMSNPVATLRCREDAEGFLIIQKDSGE